MVVAGGTFGSAGSSLQREEDLPKSTPLDGILRRMGYALPPLDRVPGEVVFEVVDDEAISGTLQCGGLSMAVSFMRRRMNSNEYFALLRRVNALKAQRDAAGWKAVMRLSGRLWVNNDAKCVLLVKQFEFSETFEGARDGNE